MPREKKAKKSQIITPENPFKHEIDVHRDLERCSLRGKKFFETVVQFMKYAEKRKVPQWENHFYTTERSYPFFGQRLHGNFGDGSNFLTNYWMGDHWTDEGFKEGYKSLISKLGETLRIQPGNTGDFLSPEGEVLTASEWAAWPILLGLNDTYLIVTHNPKIEDTFGAKERIGELDACLVHAKPEVLLKEFVGMPEITATGFPLTDFREMLVQKYSNPKPLKSQTYTSN